VKRGERFHFSLVFVIIAKNIMPADVRKSKKVERHPGWN
jgi:hypothetical protein